MFSTLERSEKEQQKPSVGTQTVAGGNSSQVIRPGIVWPWIPVFHCGRTKYISVLKSQTSCLEQWMLYICRRRKNIIILNQMVLNPSDKLQETESGKVSILNNLEDFQKYYHLLKQWGAENSRQTDITDKNTKVLNPAGHLLCLTTRSSPCEVHVGEPKVKTKTFPTQNVMHEKKTVETGNPTDKMKQKIKEKVHLLKRMQPATTYGQKLLSELQLISVAASPCGNGSSKVPISLTQLRVKWDQSTAQVPLLFFFGCSWHVT